MILEQKIIELLTPSLEDLGLSIVRLQVSGTHRKELEVMVERLDGQPVRMDDCIRASKEASAFLDVEDLISGPYILNVTSPGLDRPLMKKEDYKRFLGHKVKLETYMPKLDRKRFIGILAQATDNGITLGLEDDTEKTEIEFEYCEIRKAKLVPDLKF